MNGCMSPPCTACAESCLSQEWQPPVGEKKDGGGQGGSSSQQEPGRGRISGVLEASREIQDSFQIWNGTP